MSLLEITSNLFCLNTLKLFLIFNSSLIDLRMLKIFYFYYHFSVMVIFLITYSSFVSSSLAAYCFNYLFDF